MSYPIKTLNLLKKSKANVSTLTTTILNKLKKISSPTTRAIYIQQEVDKKIAPVLKTPLVEKFLQCKKGCSLCCHTEVGVTSDEASLLADLLDNGVEIDLDKLALQANNCEDSTKWYKLSHDDRACVFLNDKKECSIYDMRPIVCRTNLVLSNKELCSTKDGSIKPVRLLHTEDADKVIIAAYSYAKESGYLPKMLFEELIKRKTKFLTLKKVLKKVREITL